MLELLDSPQIRYYLKVWTRNCEHSRNKIESINNNKTEIELQVGIIEPNNIVTK